MLSICWEAVGWEKLGFLKTDSVGIRLYRCIFMLSDKDTKTNISDHQSYCSHSVTIFYGR